jgi:hypothetical protein
MEADKLGGYTVKEWRQMIEDKVAIYQTKFLSSSSQIYSKENAQNKEARKESVTEELYYVRNEGFLGNALLWWTKGCNGYTCDINDAHKFTREQAEKTCKDLKIQLTFVRT